MMARVAEAASIPRGFSLKLPARMSGALSDPGIRMRVLAINQANGYATLLLDAEPGVRFPAHHHAGSEECYVLSGSLHTLGRRLGPGDFLHAEPARTIRRCGPKKARGSCWSCRTKKSRHNSVISAR